MAPGKMKTRAKGSTKTEVEAIAAASPASSKHCLPSESSNPPKLFILPKETSPEARIITLHNPRTSTDSRYFYCPKKGFYEFIKVAAPKTTPRSWLLAPEIDFSEKKRKRGSDRHEGFQAYVTESADLFIATPLDPLFLLLPALSSASISKTSENKALFVASSDHLDHLTSNSPHLLSLLNRHPSLSTLLISRLSTACDSVSAGDETMYRLSLTKLLSVLLSKAITLVEAGLPVSMEEKLVRKVLEIPMASVKRRGSCGQDLAEAEDGASTPFTLTESADSQTTADSVDTAASSLPDDSSMVTSISLQIVTERSDQTFAATIPPPIVAPEGIPRLLRLRTALNYILSSYVPPHLSASLTSLLSSPSLSGTQTVDFAPLDAHLAYLSSLRLQAQQSRSFTDLSRKRGFEDEDDDEGGESRAEKKRKKEEEDKRKRAGESRGVRDLKKVNVSGMKKMSDFFKKKS